MMRAAVFWIAAQVIEQRRSGLQYPPARNRLAPLRYNPANSCVLQRTSYLKMLFSGLTWAKEVEFFTINHLYENQCYTQEAFRWGTLQLNSWAFWQSIIKHGVVLGSHPDWLGRWINWLLTISKVDAWLDVAQISELHHIVDHLQLVRPSRDCWELLYHTNLGSDFWFYIRSFQKKNMLFVNGEILVINRKLVIIYNFFKTLSAALFFLKIAFLFEYILQNALLLTVRHHDLSVIYFHFLLRFPIAIKTNKKIYSIWKFKR